jgi:putative ABC transport system permease protein
MRDEAIRIRRLVPAALRERVFDPAIADALRERRVRLRRARGVPARLAVRLLFVARALAAAIECRRLAAGARQPFERSSVRRPMLRQDLTFAVRMLRKAPGFTLAAVLATALGIGANTAIFTVVKQVLLQPLPYPDPSRLVDVNEYVRGRVAAVSPPNGRDWRAGNQTLEAMSIYNEQVVTLSGAEEPSRVYAGVIDAQFARVMRVAPLAGRAFDDNDMRPSARKVALLGYALWQRAFGADRAIVGRQVTLEGEPYEIVGVMPAGFDFPDASEAWVPLQLQESSFTDNQRGAHYLNAVGRLRPGVIPAQASADLNRIEQDLARRFPSKIEGYTVAAVPLLSSMVDSVQRPLLILFGAVAFVLLIACVNVSNLLLARATTRTGEIAVRSALGAARGRLVRQLLAESIVLSLAGGAVGVLLASWGVHALMAVAPPDLPRIDGIRIDLTILLFSVALSIAAGVVFGTVPAIVASRPDLTVFLRDAGRDGGASGRRHRLRAALVAAQVALALVLLAGAGLAIRSFQRLTGVDPGFRTDKVLTFAISLPDAPYPTLAAQASFFRAYTERLQEMPGVAAAGAVVFAPVTRAGFGGSFTIIGRPTDADEGNAQIRSITPGYMEALSIPLEAGRFFSAQDSESAPRVAIISESAARRFWPGENPIGKQLRVHVNEPIKAPREIVGIVGDVRTRAMDTAPVPVIYTPHTQYGPESMTIVVRGTGDPASLVTPMKAALASIAPGVAIGRVRSMDDLVAANVAEPRFRTLLLTIFAVVSLALAALGLYGVVAFSVSQRRAELGLRIALGADPRQVLRLVLREGMTPVAIGIAAGLAGAAAIARVMATLLFDVDPFDPVTFGVVAASLAAVALAACYVPARRATRVDPAASLR